MSVGFDFNRLYNAQEEKLLLDDQRHKVVHGYKFKKGFFHAISRFFSKLTGRAFEMALAGNTKVLVPTKEAKAYLKSCKYINKGEHLSKDDIKKRLEALVNEREGKLAALTIRQDLTNDSLDIITSTQKGFYCFFKENHDEAACARIAFNRWIYAQTAKNSLCSITKADVKTFLENTDYFENDINGYTFTAKFMKIIENKSIRGKTLKDIFDHILAGLQPKNEPPIESASSSHAVSTTQSPASTSNQVVEPLFKEESQNITLHKKKGSEKISAMNLSNSKTTLDPTTHRRSKKSQKTESQETFHVQESPHSEAKENANKSSITKNQQTFTENKPKAVRKVKSVDELIDIFKSNKSTHKIAHIDVKLLRNFICALHENHLISSTPFDIFIFLNNLSSHGEYVLHLDNLKEQVNRIIEQELDKSDTAVPIIQNTHALKFFLEKKLYVYLSDKKPISVDEYTLNLFVENKTSSSEAKYHKIKPINLSQQTLKDIYKLIENNESLLTSTTSIKQFVKESKTNPSKAQDIRILATKALQDTLAINVDIPLLNLIERYENISKFLTQPLKGCIDYLIKHATVHLKSDIDTLIDTTADTITSDPDTTIQTAQELLLQITNKLELTNQDIEYIQQLLRIDTETIKKLSLLAYPEQFLEIENSVYDEYENTISTLKSTTADVWKQTYKESVCKLLGISPDTTSDIQFFSLLIHMIKHIQDSDCKEFITDQIAHVFHPHILDLCINTSVQKKLHSRLQEIQNDITGGIRNMEKMKKKAQDSLYTTLFTKKQLYPNKMKDFILKILKKSEEHLPEDVKKLLDIAYPG